MQLQLPIDRKLPTSAESRDTVFSMIMNHFRIDQQPLLLETAIYGQRCSQVLRNSAFRKFDASFLQ